MLPNMGILVTSKVLLWCPALARGLSNASPCPDTLKWIKESRHGKGRCLVVN